MSATPERPADPRPVWERALFPKAPALRLATLRVIVTGVALAWLLALSPLLYANLGFPAARFEPVGVLSVLASPPGGAVMLLVYLATLGVGAAALVGHRYRVSGPLFALGLLWLTTYRNSWGMVFHTENLVVLHALILAVLPASDAWSLDARRERTGVRPQGNSAAYGWGPRLMATVGVLAYLIAGVAKLRNAGHAWLGGEVLLTHIAWDNLRKIELGDMHSPIGAWLSTYPAVFPPLAWASVALELGAPLALLHRRLAWIWSIGMWSFHLGVVAIMAIVFPYPLCGAAFAPLFAVEELPRRLAARARERRPSSRLARWLPNPDDS